LDIARSTPSPPRTTMTGSSAITAAKYWPFSRTWSARPASCHVLPKTVQFSAASTSAST
jgi:hypothetical protein